MTETKQKSKRIKSSLETIQNKSRNIYSNTLIMNEMYQYKQFQYNKKYLIYLQIKNKALLLQPQFGM